MPKRRATWKSKRSTWKPNTLWTVLVCTAGLVVFLACAVYGNGISNKGTDAYELNRQTGQYEPVHLEPGQTLDEE